VGENLTTLLARVNHTCPAATPCALAHCPNTHANYNTIKTERDQLKTEQQTHEQAKQQAIQAKETEIINKIITDLQLSTEREREREREHILEAVIAEIKLKITPPTDNSKEKELAEKQSKITELEAQITNLQTPQSLKDLPISDKVKAEVIKISQELGLTSE